MVIQRRSWMGQLELKILFRDCLISINLKCLIDGLEFPLVEIEIDPLVGQRRSVHRSMKTL